MTRNTSFYYSFLVLSAVQRRAITAVFDVCRAIDDCVDLETDPARAAAALDRWREEIPRWFDGRPPATEEGRRLQPFVAAFGLERAPFDALVEGVAMDAAPLRFTSFPELETYCHRVASSVGAMCVRIFGYEDPGTLVYARDLGVALQLTNILRDVATDYARGRCYIPADDLERFQCAEADIADEIAHAGHGVRNRRVQALLEHQAARARVFFDRAARALPPVDAPRLVSAEVMRAILLGRAPPDRGRPL